MRLHSGNISSGEPLPSWVRSLFSVNRCFSPSLTRSITHAVSIDWTLTVQSIEDKKVMWHGPCPSHAPAMFYEHVTVDT